MATRTDGEGEDERLRVSSRLCPQLIKRVDHEVGVVPRRHVVANHLQQVATIQHVLGNDIKEVK